MAESADGKRTMRTDERSGKRSPDRSRGHPPKRTDARLEGLEISKGENLILPCADMTCPCRVLRKR